jgi:hypothetical protein
LGVAGGEKEREGEGGGCGGAKQQSSGSCKLSGKIKVRLSAFKIFKLLSQKKSILKIIVFF